MTKRTHAHMHTHTHIHTHTVQYSTETFIAHALRVDYRIHTYMYHATEMASCMYTIADSVASTFCIYIHVPSVCYILCNVILVGSENNANFGHLRSHKGVTWTEVPA